MNKQTKQLSSYDKIRSYKAIFYDQYGENYSYAQKELSKQMYESNFFITLSSRRAGKSFVFASEFIDYGLNWCQKGDQMLIIGNNENNVRNLIVEGAMLEPFGGKATLDSVNQVYLSTSLDVVKKAMDQKVRYWETALGQEELEAWIKEGYITTDLSYVKLFIDPLSNSGLGNKEQARYEGKLFSGVTMKIAGGNNPNIGSILSGQAYRVAWLEEIGQLDKNIFGVFIPTVLDRKDEEGYPNGKVIVNGTPSRDEENAWFQKDFVTPYTTGEGMEYEERLGFEIYSDVRNIKGIETINGTSLSFTNRSTLMLGDFEKVFPYIYGGITTFNSVQSSRAVPSLDEAFYEDKMPKEALAITGEDGKPIVEVSKYFERKYNLENLKYDFVYKELKHYKYELVPASWAENKAGATGTISFEDYSKEYRMMFNSIETKAFKHFDKDCIIKRDNFNPYLYNSVAGFDHGKGENVELDVNKHIKESGTCWAKVAIIPYADTYQYVVWDVGFLAVPSFYNIASCWLELWDSGCPVISDDSVFRTQMGGGSDYDWLLYEQPRLKEHQLFGYKKSVYPCFKRKRAGEDKVKLFDEMFGRRNILKTKEEYQSFSQDQDQKGRQILITDNCLSAIDFFKKLKIRRKDSKLETRRDDIYDAITYAIDFIEMKIAPTQLRNFWDEWLYFKRLKENPRPEQQMQREIPMDLFW